MNRHKSFVALQVINWVGGAVVRLHMRHLEPTEDRFVEDELGERLDGPEVDVVRRLLTIRLELGKPMVNFFELMFVVIQPSVLRNPRSRIFR